MKKCTKCQEQKENSEFHVNNGHKDKLSSWCKKCAITTAKSHYQFKSKDNIKRWSKRAKHKLVMIVNQIKSQYQCYFCKEPDACCLDFHHPNQDKIDNVKDILDTKNKPRLFEKINKCIVVCANCHRKIHSGKIQCVNPDLCNVDIQQYFDLIGTKFYFKN